MRTTIFTTAHPLDDVRVYSKYAKSFIALGGGVSWIGPDFSYFAGDLFRDPDIGYDVYSSTGSRRDRLKGTLNAAIKLARTRNIDWLYCPDPDGAILATLLRPFHRAKIIFDVHEEYHGDLLSRWLGKRFGRLASHALIATLRVAVKKTEILVGVNETVLSPYKHSAGVSLVVRNSAPQWFADDVPTEHVAPGALRIFHGKATATGGTDKVLDALQQLDTETEVLMFPSPGSVDGSSYVPGFPQLVSERGLSNKVLCVDSVPHSGVPALMDSCQVGMIAYGLELGRASLPNRLFEYMARGLAIFAPSYSPLIRDIIETHNIGITRDFEDADSIADGIAWLEAHPGEVKLMGERARKAFLEHYSWDSEFDELAKLVSASAKR